MPRLFAHCSQDHKTLVLVEVRGSGCLIDPLRCPVCNETYAKQETDRLTTYVRDILRMR